MTRVFFGVTKGRKGIKGLLCASKGVKGFSLRFTKGSKRVLTYHE